MNILKVKTVTLVPFILGTILTSSIDFEVKNFLNEVSNRDLLLKDANSESDSEKYVPDHYYDKNKENEIKCLNLTSKDDWQMMNDNFTHLYNLKKFYFENYLLAQLMNVLLIQNTTLDRVHIENEYIRARNSLENIRREINDDKRLLSALVNKNSQYYTNEEILFAKDKFLYELHNSLDSIIVIDIAELKVLYNEQFLKTNDYNLASQETYKEYYQRYIDNNDFCNSYDTFTNLVNIERLKCLD